METTERTSEQRTDKIRCKYCGEEYSSSYKKCPFCDGKRQQEGACRREARSSAGNGGKRLSGGRGHFSGIEPVRVIGWVLALILFAAAIYILITALGPLFHKGEAAPASSVSEASSASVSAAVSTSEPYFIEDAGTSTPPVDGAVSSVLTPIVHATGITFDTTDVTLKANESFTLKASVTPSDSDDEIVWTSSNEAVATVTAGGTVTNVNQGSGASATITATAGDVSATCTVRCAGGSTPAATTPAPATETTPAPAPQPAQTGTPTAVNKSGSVTGTTTGLLVRSGAGREHEAQDTLTNGTDVTVLEDTGTGWYKISYSGAGGKAVTGYASKDYITVK